MLLFFTSFYISDLEKNGPEAILRYYLPEITVLLHLFLALFKLIAENNASQFILASLLCRLGDSPRLIAAFNQE